MTSKQGPPFEDLTELMTTSLTEVIHWTTGSGMTSSSSRGVGFYFMCAVLVVAVVGAAANAVVLYALVASKQHRKHALIFNQNLLDFANCFFLVTSNVARLDHVYLSGTLGYWLCMIVMSELFSWAPFIGFIINLAAITVERYLKIVHTAWAKQKLRKRVTYLAISLTWIIGFIIAAVSIFLTTAVVDGTCYIMAFFNSDAARLAYWISYILSFYFAILVIFIFCYGRILMTIRRQASVMAAHSAAASSSAAAAAAQNTQSKKIQTSIIKTMITVSVLFAV